PVAFVASCAHVVGFPVRCCLRVAYLLPNRPYSTKHSHTQNTAVSVQKPANSAISGRMLMTHNPCAADSGPAGQPPEIPGQYGGPRRSPLAVVLPIMLPICAASARLALSIAVSRRLHGPTGTAPEAVRRRHRHTRGCRSSGRLSPRD